MSSVDSYQGALDQATRLSIIQDESIQIAKQEKIPQEEALAKSVENYKAREEQIDATVRQQVEQ
jgi:hypothetical protein